MDKNVTSQLELLFKELTGNSADSINPIPQSGSDRQYFRLKKEGKSVIGAFNPDVEENRTFFYLTRHFFSKQFPVAEILKISNDEKYYLLTDLGDITLFNQIVCTRWDSESSAKTISSLKKSLQLLARLQVEGAKGLNFSKCFPKSEFDLQSVMWDFNYFKYCFLKPSGIRFNEATLEEDFASFSQILLSQKMDFFHYRDFQSRNIMLVNDEPYLIDYQGGRKGPLLYDVASFLYQAKANFPQQVKNELLDFYIESVKAITPVDTEKLKSQFPAFALFRVMQTLGAYGYRGFFERRSHFIQSIPLAASNLKHLLKNIHFTLPHLNPLLLEISEKFGLQAEQKDEFDGLTVEITSFSFKNGYPTGHPEHGGGFVFDCRALPNPGRLLKYKNLTGLDEPVADFLEKHNEIERFFTKVYELVDESVIVYSSREFKHISVAFGCTGGQHRSVYMANRLAEGLKKNNKIRVQVAHRELKL